MENRKNIEIRKYHFNHWGIWLKIDSFRFLHPEKKINEEAEMKWYLYQKCMGLVSMPNQVSVHVDSPFSKEFQPARL